MLIGDNISNEGRWIVIFLQACDGLCSIEVLIDNGDSIGVATSTALKVLPGVHVQILAAIHVQPVGPAVLEVVGIGFNLCVTKLHALNNFREVTVAFQGCISGRTGHSIRCVADKRLVGHVVEIGVLVEGNDSKHGSRLCIGHTGNLSAIAGNIAAGAVELEALHGDGSCNGNDLQAFFNPCFIAIEVRTAVNGVLTIGLNNVFVARASGEPVNRLNTIAGSHLDAIISLERHREGELLDVFSLFQLFIHCHLVGLDDAPFGHRAGDIEA